MPPKRGKNQKIEKCKKCKLIHMSNLRCPVDAASAARPKRLVIPATTVVAVPSADESDDSLVEVKSPQRSPQPSTRKRPAPFVMPSFADIIRRKEAKNKAEAEGKKRRLEEPRETDDGDDSSSITSITTIDKR